MKHNLRIMLLVSILFCTAQLTFAQEKDITGTVTSSADGMSLPGVNIIVDGTTNGAQTDFDGNYSITASVGDVLTYSFLGMTTVKQTIGDSSTVNDCCRNSFLKSRSSPKRLGRSRRCSN